MSGSNPRKKYSSQDSFTIKVGCELLARIDRLVPRQGFMSVSDFIRYAIRKELDYQEDHTTVPKIGVVV